MKFEIGDMVTVKYIPCPDDFDYDGVKLEDAWYSIANNDLSKTFGLIYEETEDEYLLYFMPKEDDFWATAAYVKALKRHPEEDGEPLSETDAILEKQEHISINRLKKIS